jgi:hypothetical protein
LMMHVTNNIILDSLILTCALSVSHVLVRAYNTQTPLNVAGITKAIGQSQASSAYSRPKRQLTRHSTQTHHHLLRQATRHKTVSHLLISTKRRAYLDKRIRRFAHTLAHFTIDVLFAHVRAPLDDHFFLEHINLVKCHKDLRDCRDEVRVIDSDEAFEAAEKGLLVFLRSHNLMEGQMMH